MDLFATNRPSLVRHIEVIPGISDHEIVSVELTLSVPVSKLEEHIVYLWDRANFTEINDVIAQLANSFLSVNTIDTPVQELWDSFKGTCHRALELVPRKHTSRSIKYPWITRHIKRLSNKKQRLYNRARHSGLQSDWLAYRDMKKLIQNECRKAHDKYVANMLTTSNDHANKRFWSYIKGKRNEHIGIPSLVKDNQIFSDSISKANILNKQFSSVFNRDDDYSIPLPTLDCDPYPDLPDIQINPLGVANLLNELDPFKAPGPDGIPSKLLKETSANIAPLLTLIYRASLKQGKLPNDWKRAFVAPIFKKGSRTNPSNYRPISLTCICCKLLEHIISSAISTQANHYNIICKQQHGFRKNHSCETQLLETVNDLALSLNAGEHTDFILLDFSKAFDKVSHTCLLHKLRHYGISGELLRWIRDFLTNRSQEVILNNIHSDSCKVLSGVPQGSVLGPLLFLLFINDLPNKITSNIRLYADDVVIYRSIYSVDDVVCLQMDLDILSQWASDWRMAFNLDKCEHLVITNIRSPLCSEYKINNHYIHKVSHAKYLGVTIDHNLSWSNHIGIISRKANSVYAFLKRNLRQCSLSIKSLAYLTYVRPILEYASIIWAPYTKSHIATMEKIQRRAACFVCNDYSRHASVTAMLDMLNWSSLEHRRKEAKCIMFYKIINNLVCVDFHHYLQPITSSTRGHHLRYTHLQARVDVFRHSYLPSTIRLWNMLPAQTVSSSSIDIFKDNLANVQ